MKKLYVLLALGFGLIQSCSKKNCSNAICTEQYAMLLVKLSSNSNPNLSEIRTESILLKNNVVLALDSSKNAFQGQYFELATDAHLKVFGDNSINAVIFKVYQADSLIYQGNYTVTTDCCHIDLKEGKMDVEL